MLRADCSLASRGNQEGENVAYAHTNSKATTYYLHRKVPTLKNGR